MEAPAGDGHEQRKGPCGKYTCRKFTPKCPKKKSAAVLVRSGRPRFEIDRSRHPHSPLRRDFFCGELACARCGTALTAAPGASDSRATSSACKPRCSTQRQDSATA